MKPALQSQRPVCPNQWQALHLGTQLKNITEQKLVTPTRQFFGYHLVRLGNLSSELALSECPIKHRINVVNQQTAERGVVAESSQLPFANNSIDAFVLAHELDFAQDPHQIMREVDRCIVPDGHVAIVGFNPVSLPGCLKWLPLNSARHLQSANFFSPHRIKDWLSLLGYQIIEEQFYLHSSFVFETSLDVDGRWAGFAQKYLPLLASVYLIVGKKREFPLSLVKPSWQLKTRFSPVGASVRNIAAKQMADKDLMNLQDVRY